MFSDGAKRVWEGGDWCLVEVGDLRTAQCSMYHHCIQHTQCISGTQQYHCKHSVNYAMIAMMLAFIGDTRNSVLSACS